MRNGDNGGRTLNSRLADECRCHHSRDRHDWTAAYEQPCRASKCPCRSFHKVGLKKPKHLVLSAMFLLALPLLAHGQELQYWKHFKDVPKQQEPVSKIQSPSHYDWSFTKDPKFYAGVGFSFGVTAYDISTSHGHEHTRLLRGSNGELNRAKYYGITATTNAGFLPLDLMANHRWRYVSLFGRVGLALWRLRGAVHNGGQR